MSTRWRPPTARARCSSRTICGCATSRAEVERPLTTDGVETSATRPITPAGWPSDRPIVLWSPDSRKIATFQHDGRGVGDMYLVETKAGHPMLEAWKYPLPGDSSGDAATRDDRHRAPARRSLQDAARLHRATVTDHVAVTATATWSPDGCSSRSSRARATTRTPGCASPMRERARCGRCSRSRRHALRIAGRLARAAGVERVDLVVAARQLDPPLSLRPRDRPAQEPHHHGRGNRHADRARRRENAHDLLHGDGKEAGRDPVLPRTCIGSGSTEGQHVADSGERSHASDVPDGRFIVDTYSARQTAAAGRAARRRTAPR